jgi:hypothetical protein
MLQRLKLIIIDFSYLGTKKQRKSVCGNNISEKKRESSDICTSAPRNESRDRGLPLMIEEGRGKQKGDRA